MRLRCGRRGRPGRARSARARPSGSTREHATRAGGRRRAEAVHADDDRSRRRRSPAARVGRLLDLPLDEARFDGRQRAAQRVDAVEQLDRLALRCDSSAPRWHRRRRPDRRCWRRRSRAGGSAACAARSSRSPRSAAPSASSRPLQCSDCVPPSTAASACSATRTMLLSGCWAVSVLPAVCVWKRSCCARGSVAPNRSRMMRAHRRRAARNLAISSRKLLCALKKNDSRWPNAFDVEPGVDRRLDVGDAVGQRERHLLHRRRARLADVIAADRDRVPLRHVPLAERDDVGDDAQRRARRIDVGAARDVLLEDVVLHRAGQRARRDPAPPRDRDVQRQQDDRRGVDGHRRRDAIERDAVEQGRHVLDRVDRHADPADLAGGQRVVRVVADLRRQVEGDAQARDALREQVAVSPVRLGGGSRSRRTAASSRAGRGTCPAGCRG